MRCCKGGAPPRRGGAFARIADDASGAAARSAARLGEAVATYALGDVERARSVLRVALALAPAGSPEELRAAYLLGVRLNEEGAHEEAVETLRPYAVLGTGLALTPFVVAEYASALAGLGEIARAESVWDLLLATPTVGQLLRTPILQQRLELAIAAEDLEGQRRWLGELVAVTGSPMLRQALAAVGFLLGDVALFEQQLRAIIVESPWSEEAVSAVQDLRTAGFAVDPGDEGFVLYRQRLYAQARAVLGPASEDPTLTGEALAYRTYFLAASYEDDGFPLESVPLYDAVAANPQAGAMRIGRATGRRARWRAWGSLTRRRCATASWRRSRAARSPRRRASGRASCGCRAATPRARSPCGS